MTRSENDALLHDPEGGVARLAAIMARLRDPDGGCPWDLEQDFASIAPYTIEEAYEVADAIERGAMGELRDELGDLLLQVVYHAQMAAEAGAFGFADVARAVSDKMIRRHPHVFGDASRDKTAAQQTRDWEAIKAAERAGAALAPSALEGVALAPSALEGVALAPSALEGVALAPSALEGVALAQGALGGVALAPSALDGVALGLPALTRAVKLQNRAARVGFDWPNAGAVLDKIAEETAELVEARDGGDAGRIAEEYGDLIFVMANLARHLAIDPEAALRAANAKFVRRFRAVEAALARDGRTPAQSDLAEMDALWDAAKAAERAGG